MKLISFFLSIALGVMLSCHTVRKAQPLPCPGLQSKPPPAFVTWDKKMIELGTVKKGEKRSMNFEFTNTSGADIQIDIVDACDCTKVDFPRGVIAPGAKANSTSYSTARKKTLPKPSASTWFSNKPTLQAIPA